MSDPTSVGHAHSSGHPHTGNHGAGGHASSADLAHGGETAHSTNGSAPAPDQETPFERDGAAQDGSAPHGAAPHGEAAGEQGETLGDRLQFAASLAATCAVLGYLLFGPSLGSHGGGERKPPPDVVRQAGNMRLEIDSKSKLNSKLVETPIKPQRIDDPILTVTGTVVACLRPGAGEGPDGWQFSSSEMLSTYTDWRKAQADVVFSETLLTQVQQLSDTRIGAQEKVVARLEQLFKDGAGPEKDLLAERANLIKFRIEGRRDVHEADSAVRVAKRSESALRRQLQQSGLDPELLAKSTSDLDIVMADVPEGAVSRVRVGQACRATFFGVADEVFHGNVDSISPVISEARRSLRVLFIISDPHDRLRAGMFAEIGLGTDARETVLIPAEGVIHIGRSDYVLIKDSAPDVWRVAEVRVGEPRGDGRGAAPGDRPGLPRPHVHSAGERKDSREVEVISGVAAGDRIIGMGAILLKPAMVKALHAAAESSAQAVAEARPAEAPAAEKRGGDEHAADAAPNESANDDAFDDFPSDDGAETAMARSEGARAAARTSKRRASGARPGKTP